MEFITQNFLLVYIVIIQSGEPGVEFIAQNFLLVSIILIQSGEPRVEFVAQNFLLVYSFYNTEWSTLRGVHCPKFFISI